LKRGRVGTPLMCLSVCHNRKAFKTLKNNRKKAGPFSVWTTVPPVTGSKKFTVVRGAFFF
jgi:hypothetical protein